MKKYRVLQFGTGWWGSGWAKHIIDSDRTELVGIVDSNAEVLAGVCESLGISESLRFTEVQTALDTVQADFALIVVPPEAHAPVAIACLNRGLDVLMEKPFAPTPEEAMPVVELAKKLDKNLMISQTFRFRKGAKTVQRLIREGYIGRVEQVFGRFAKAPAFASDNFRCTMEEPLIVDMAIHHFDFVRGIFGLEPNKVRARSWNPSWSWYNGNASAVVEFETEDGAFVSWQGSYCSRGPLTTWDGAWEIQGTLGSLHWEDNEVWYRPTELANTVFTPGALELPGDLMKIELDFMPQQERAAVLETYVASLDNGVEPESSGRDNLGSIGLVLAAKESAVNGGTTVVPCGPAS